jgi:2-polyprenyl-3-methyl-5-hydroxy-6-metoxy-1,4-benzoquinol methylase
LDLVYPEDLIDSENRDKDELMKEKKWDGLIKKLSLFLSPNSTICDVGARYGVLVQKLDDFGFNSFGIELNKGAVNYSKKVGIENVFHSDILGIKSVVDKLKFESVNAFIMDDVLEHLVDPYVELSTLSKYQKSGDFLFLRQMDHNSPGRYLFRKNWYLYQPAAHMFFFDDSSISRLLKKVGYDVVATYKTPLLGQIKPFIVQMLRYLGIKKYLMPLQKNGKQMYLDKRGRLEDMFLVVAKKI